MCRRRDTVDSQRPSESRSPITPREWVTQRITVQAHEQVPTASLIDKPPATLDDVPHMFVVRGIPHRKRKLRRGGTETFGRQYVRSLDLAPYRG
jgi:hypothetical protein